MATQIHGNLWGNYCQPLDFGIPYSQTKLVLHVARRHRGTSWERIDIDNLQIDVRCSEERRTWNGLETFSLLLHVPLSIGCTKNLQRIMLSAASCWRVWDGNIWYKKIQQAGPIKHAWKSSVRLDSTWSWLHFRTSGTGFGGPLVQ